MTAHQQSILKAAIPLGVVLVLWAVVNLGLLYSNGVKVVSDSERYIEYANGLSTGFYADSFNFWYIGYAAYLLVVFHAFGGGVTEVVVGQYCLAFLAVIALHRASFLLSRSTFSSVATCVLFIVFADISLWNSYILTESLYISFTCFSIYFMVRVYKQKASAMNIAAAIAVLIFTFFIKPTGIALLAALVGLAMYEVIGRQQVRWVRAVSIIGLTTLVILLANKMIASYLIMENYAAGEVIYAVREYGGSASVEGLIVSPPADLWMPDASQPPIVKVWLFIFHNPVYWAKLFF